MSSSHSGSAATVEELKVVVEEAGDRLVVVDLRNPDAQVEPEDQQTLAVAGLPDGDYRPHAINVVWDRTTNTMPLDNPVWQELPKDTPIITHCGAGRRGQMAKEYLETKLGFTNVYNGAGPKDTELWAVYGQK
jgi:rhodanese-related sulfurtransferase